MGTMRAMRCLVCITIFLGGVLTVTATAQTQRTTREDADFVQTIRQSIQNTLDGISNPSDFARARTELTGIFDQVIAYAPLTASGSLRDAALALRLVDNLQFHTADERIGMLQYLQASPRLASALMFLIQPEDDRERLFSVLSGLKRDRRDQLEEFAPLTAAICVVHDKPAPHPRHGRVGVEPTPLFDHFASNAKAMEFEPRTLAPELMVFVVDVPVGVSELRWALEKYKGDRMIGRHYHAVPYDINHFRRGAPKRIDQHPYILPNLLTYGGVCSDQAFFASHIAKAVGIPSVIISGRGGGIGHCWVGYLVKTRRGAEWNFKEGCYPEYEDVRGTVMHPQTGLGLSHGDIALLAEFVSRSSEERELAIALTDAATRLGEIARTRTAWPPPAPASLPNLMRRGTGVEDRLALLEAAVNACPPHRGAWLAVIDLAQEGELDAKARHRWALALDRVAGRNYPDFSFAMLVPMIRAEEDIAEQDRLWNWAFGTFRSRPDLAGAIRLEQAEMWERTGKPAEAWKAYQEVVNRYINDSPVVRDALFASERLLRSENKTSEIVPLYANAFRRVKPAGRVAAQFRVATNWYRIGTEYVRVLKEFGRDREAEAVLTQLNASESR